MSWPSLRELFHHHHNRAHDDLNVIELQVPDPFARGHGHTLVHAVLALVAVERGQLRELTKIRRALEAQSANQTAALHLCGALTPKEGTSAMPIGPFYPAETEDVLFTIAPVNAAGVPTTGPFNWALDNGFAGSLVVAVDGLSCLLVTAAGNFDAAIVTVADSVSGLTESATVSRSIVPPDNAAVNLGLTGQVVGKTA